MELIGSSSETIKRQDKISDSEELTGDNANKKASKGKERRYLKATL